MVTMVCLTAALCLDRDCLGKFSRVEDIPENMVHDHERNGLPRLSSMSDAEITERSGKVHFAAHHLKKCFVWVFFFFFSVNYICKISAKLM